MTKPLLTIKLSIVSLKQFKGPTDGPFIYDWRHMLTNDACSKELFKDVSSLIESLGLNLVETSLNKVGLSNQMRVVLSKENGEISTDDLEMAYNIIYPRYEVMLGDRDLTMEVTSPGMQRNFKDILEFNVFRGRDVRVYSTVHSCYVVGRIDSADEGKVVLTDYLIEDKNERGDSIELNYKDIAKAKLEYRWEGKNA